MLHIPTLADSVVLAAGHTVSEPCVYVLPCASLRTHGPYMYVLQFTPSLEQAQEIKIVAAMMHKGKILEFYYFISYDKYLLPYKR